MVQLGFVIDQTRCIGCHACTVACKSENEVPVGVFRTWVKYTEQGTFPAVKRSFAVLRCNQCSEPPCVAICPTSALEKRASDGIVDVDPKACIGCKSCMHGCPYDALYIDPGSGTAEKCNFCAHRSDMGLAPACAVVCPTQAILPGDFDDPQSFVSRMRASETLVARKVEAGTRPNVHYRGAAPATLEPLASQSAAGGIWSDTLAGPRAETQQWYGAQGEADARTVYDVPREPLWGGKISGYVFFKSLAAGVFMAGARVLLTSEDGARAGLFVSAAATLFLLLTTALLVLDLKRPERFLYILLRPNWSSWLTRGSFLLVGYGALLGAWLALGALDVRLGAGARLALVTTTWLAATASAVYTAFLFGQAKGRVLWMRRHMVWHLFAQALVAGSAFLLLADLAVDVLSDADAASLRLGLLAFLLLHGFLTLLEPRLSPRGREAEYARTSALVTHGPLAKRHWLLGVAVGIVVPTFLLAIVPAWPVLAPWAVPLSAACVLVGLWVEEDLLVRAAQLLPIS